MPAGWIAFAVLGLLLGLASIAASRRIAPRAFERGGRMLAAHDMLRFLGVLLVLYALLQLLFALV